MTKDSDKIKVVEPKYHFGIWGTIERELEMAKEGRKSTNKKIGKYHSKIMKYAKSRPKSFFGIKTR